MSFVNIRTKIKAKLDAQKGTGKPLVDVFDEHRTGFSGYPSATFEPTRVESQFETNEENLRSYGFSIFVHQEMEKLGRSGAIGVLCAVADTLIDDFDVDYSLGGVIEWSNAAPADLGIYDEGSGKVMYIEIKLVCNKSKNLNT